MNATRGGLEPCKRSRDNRNKLHNEKSLYIAVEAFVFMLAERTGLEPATPGVTGRYSNQLNYRSFSLTFAR